MRVLPDEYGKVANGEVDAVDDEVVDEAVDAGDYEDPTQEDDSRRVVWRRLTPEEESNVTTKEPSKSNSKRKQAKSKQIPFYSFAVDSSDDEFIRQTSGIEVSLPEENAAQEEYDPETLSIAPRNKLFRYDPTPIFKKKIKKRSIENVSIDLKRKVEEQAKLKKPELIKAKMTSKEKVPSEIDERENIFDHALTAYIIPKKLKEAAVTKLATADPATRLEQEIRSVEPKEVNIKVTDEFEPNNEKSKLSEGEGKVIPAKKASIPINQPKGKTARVNSKGDFDQSLGKKGAYKKTSIVLSEKVKPHKRIMPKTVKEVQTKEIKKQLAGPNNKRSPLKEPTTKEMKKGEVAENSLKVVAMEKEIRHEMNPVVVLRPVKLTNANKKGTSTPTIIPSTNERKEMVVKLTEENNESEKVNKPLTKLNDKATGSNKLKTISFLHCTSNPRDNKPKYRGVRSKEVTTHKDKENETKMTEQLETKEVNEQTKEKVKVTPLQENVTIAISPRKVFIEVANTITVTAEIHSPPKIRKRNEEGVTRILSMPMLSDLLCGKGRVQEVLKDGPSTVSLEMPVAPMVVSDGDVAGGQWMSEMGRAEGTSEGELGVERPGHVETNGRVTKEIIEATQATLKNMHEQIENNELLLREKDKAVRSDEDSTRETEPERMIVEQSAESEMNQENEKKNIEIEDRVGKKIEESMFTPRKDTQEENQNNAEQTSVTSQDNRRQELKTKKKIEFNGV